MSNPHVRVIASAGEPIEVLIDGVPAELRPKERAVAAALTLRAPETVTVGLLMSMVWPVSPPSTAKQSIHNHLARLRKVAPGLVRSERAGYRLDPDVDVEVGASDEDGANLLVEFADINGWERVRRVFAQRHQTVADDDPAEAIREGRAADLIVGLTDAVAADGLDERSWWLLAAATTLVDGIEAATGVLEQARQSLVDVGLEPGRRLLDLERMIRDGVDSPDALLRDPHGIGTESRLGELEPQLRGWMRDIRALWADNEQFTIELRGPDGFARRELLARIVDESRANGFATASLRCQLTDIGPPTPRLAHVGVRPVIAVVDAADTSADLAGVRRTLYQAVEVGPAPTGWVVAFDPAANGDLRLDDFSLPEQHLVGGTIRVDLSDVTTRFDTPALTPLRGVGRLLAVLSLLGEPVHVDAIESIVPDAAAAALDAARAGLVRVDTAAQLIDLAAPGIGIAAIDSLDVESRTQLISELLGLQFPAIDDARRQTRRAAFALVTAGPDADVTVAATLAAAGHHASRGDFPAAAAVLERTATPLELQTGRTSLWCRLMIEAGKARLAGGDVSGDTLLQSVITAARAVHDLEAAASATLEWCRLGTAAGAGSIDTERLRIVDALAKVVETPAQQAKIGAAASMVLSLADEPELLRKRFDAAVTAAMTSNEANVLADVLPLTYMSWPLHSDALGRLAHAARLIELADELGREDARWEALQLRYSTELMTSDPSFRASIDELEAVATGVHDRSREWEMHFIRSNAAFIDGNLAEARRLIDDSLAFAGEVHEERVAAVFGAHHLVAALIDGTVAEFLDPVRQLVVEQPGVGAWQAALAVCAAAAGETDEATAAVHHVLRDGDINLRQDPTYTAGLITLGEAVAILGDAELIERVERLLAPLAGTWSWCGSCTFGPIDLTRARMALAAGNLRSAESIATEALSNCSSMRAPLFAEQATDVLLSALDASSATTNA